MQQVFPAHQPRARHQGDGGQREGEDQALPSGDPVQLVHFHLPLSHQSPIT